METKGIVIAVLDPKSGVSASGKEWKTQTFVIETGGKYSRNQAFSVFGTERTIPKVGDVVEVEFEFESREWNGNWYSEGRCFKLEVVGESPSPKEAKAEVLPPTTPEPAVNADEADDLPF